MRVNYLDILLTNNEKYGIVEFAISYRKGIETNSKKWCENKKAKAVPDSSGRAWVSGTHSGQMESSSRSLRFNGM